MDADEQAARELVAEYRHCLSSPETIIPLLEDDIAAALRRAAEKEREACAKVAATHSFLRDIEWWRTATKKEVGVVACESVAAAIRARSGA